MRKGWINSEGNGVRTYVRALKLTFEFLQLWFHHRWTFFPGYAFAVGVAAAAVAWIDADDYYHVLRYCLLSQLTTDFNEIQKEEGVEQI